MITLSRNSFSFFEIKEEYKKNFVQTTWHELSDFQAESLRWLGDAIRSRKSEFFWSNGCYCWYEENQTKVYAVWMTENGIAMYEDITGGKLYRIEFVR